MSRLRSLVEFDAHMYDSGDACMTCTKGAPVEHVSFRKQKAEGSKQKARRQKAGGRRQKAENTLGRLIIPLR